MKSQFKITSVIRLQIDHEDVGRPASQLVMNFMRWCEANEILGFRGSSTGPTGLVKYFEVRDKPEIREWLHAHGVKEALDA